MRRRRRIPAPRTSQLRVHLSDDVEPPPPLVLRPVRRHVERRRRLRAARCGGRRRLCPEYVRRAGQLRGRGPHARRPARPLVADRRSAVDLAGERAIRLGDRTLGCDARPASRQRSRRRRRPDRRTDAALQSRRRARIRVERGGDVRLRGQFPADHDRGCVRRERRDRARQLRAGGCRGRSRAALVAGKHRRPGLAVQRYVRAGRRAGRGLARRQLRVQPGGGRRTNRRSTAALLARRSRLAHGRYHRPRHRCGRIRAAAGARRLKARKGSGRIGRSPRTPTYGFAGRRLVARRPDPRATVAGARFGGLPMVCNRRLRERRSRDASPCTRRERETTLERQLRHDRNHRRLSCRKRGRRADPAACLRDEAAAHDRDPDCGGLNLVEVRRGSAGYGKAAAVRAPGRSDPRRYRREGCHQASQP